MVQKYGRQNGLQRYKCSQCNKCYSSKRKTKRKTNQLWLDYTFKRQTLDNLVESTGISQRQIRRILKKANVPKFKNKPKDTNTTVSLVTDTTYFGRYAVMVFRCFKRRANLLWFFVEKEKLEYYLFGIEHLEEMGYTIPSVVCDGFSGLKQALSARDYKVQLCQFHVMKTVRKHLTNKPKLEAGRELRVIMLTIPRTNHDTLKQQLDDWHEKWKEFLKERTTDPETGKWHYIHKRIRSAYRTLTNALPNLYTYQAYPELNIPNTTNILDGTFSHLKQKIRVHRGLNINTQMKMVHTILNRPSVKKKPTRNVH